ncbi:universal stress protein [Mesorhizobium sp. WSM2239]|uniref:Universal stress protein n=2 Tax=unclassified Mesorhizobium TaxID=325217 RepID=A0AAU8D8K0_9HYPH
MPFKTVLSVTGADHSDQDVRLVANLCAEIGAHLSVLIMSPPPLLMWPRPLCDCIPAWPEQRALDRLEKRSWQIGRLSQDMDRLEKQSWQIERFSNDMARLQKRSREVRTLLRGMRLSYDVDTDYGDQANIGDVVRQRALCADLTIVGPAFLNDDDLGRRVIDGSLFETGKPVLLVAPKGAEATLRPRRVLVGWNSRVQASRAVREALDLLSGAEEVRLAVLDPEASCNGNGLEPEAGIVAYLARHGVRVAIDRLPSAGQPVATVLAQHAVDTSADMIVMGAYGRRRVRDRIFGGVTRWIVKKPPLPLFLAL